MVEPSERCVAHPFLSGLRGAGRDTPSPLCREQDAPSLLFPGGTRRFLRGLPCLFPGSLVRGPGILPSGLRDHAVLYRDGPAGTACGRWRGEAGTGEAVVYREEFGRGIRGEPAAPSPVWCFRMPGDFRRCSTPGRMQTRRRVESGGGRDPSLPLPRGDIPSIPFSHDDPP